LPPNHRGHTFCTQVGVTAFPNGVIGITFNTK
jgi:hypothetical protein